MNSQSIQGKHTVGARTYRSSFVDELPPDPLLEPGLRQVHQACYSRVTPTAVSAPKLVAHSAEVASFLGFPSDEVRSAGFASVFGGNQVTPSMRPFAACYGGHQFGNWAGQLGDGRAISLGALTASDGEQWELQLKGAGPTPYSRRADGRAVMRSSVREFLCSEAMFHLGVPTTRALSLVATGDRVVRDMFYDGNPKEEPGAIVCRVAPTFIRFGNFELFAQRRDAATLSSLIAYTLRHHFKELAATGESPSGEQVSQMFARVAESTAVMVAHWMRVGFVHGVMNTDNMSILGLTIDYGPYGWLEDFDPAWTPNTTDAEGRRYCYGNQPGIAQWNLAKLGTALLPLVGEPGPLEESLKLYETRFNAENARHYAEKLGLTELSLGAPDADEPAGDAWLLDELHRTLSVTETDMTIFFRQLARLPVSQEMLEQAREEALLEVVRPALYAPEDLSAEQAGKFCGWLRSYIQRRLQDGRSAATCSAQMNSVNPKYVLRNYLAQLAIDEAENGNGDAVYELLNVLRSPYEEQPKYEKYAEKRPEWARDRAGCSMLSCSS